MRYTVPVCVRFRTTLSRKVWNKQTSCAATQEEEQDNGCEIRKTRNVGSKDNNSTIFYHR